MMSAHSQTSVYQTLPKPQPTGASPLSLHARLLVSSDGSFLAVGSHDNFIYIYNVTESGRRYIRSGKCNVSQYQIHVSGIFSFPPVLLSNLRCKSVESFLQRADPHKMDEPTNKHVCVPKAWQTFFRFKPQTSPTVHDAPLLSQTHTEVSFQPVPDALSCSNNHSRQHQTCIHAPLKLVPNKYTTSSCLRDVC